MKSHLCNRIDATGEHFAWWNDPDSEKADCVLSGMRQSIIIQTMYKNGIDI